MRESHVVDIHEACQHSILQSSNKSITDRAKKIDIHEICDETGTGRVRREREKGQFSKCHSDNETNNENKYRQQEE